MMNSTQKRESRRNPQETANFLSSFFFGWTLPIFWKGSRRDLNISDLYDPLKSDESEILGDRLEKEWENECLKSKAEFERRKDGTKTPFKPPNLMWPIIRMFWAPYTVQMILSLVQGVVLRIVQPILQGWVISYFNPDQNLITRSQVLYYAGLLVATKFAIVLIMRHMYIRTRQIGMSIRVACCSMIYRKVLRLDQGGAAGQIANLISNDVSRFDYVTVMYHNIWIMPIQVIVVGCVMWQFIGIVTLVGIGGIIVQTIPLQGYLSSLSAKIREKIAVATDKRVQLMTELISGIQVVKMYSWEKPFEVLVSNARKLEMKLISYASYVRGFCICNEVLTEKITLFSTLIALMLLGTPLDAETTFMLVNLFETLQLTCAFAFPQAIIQYQEARVSINRISEFLTTEEVERTKDVESTMKSGINGTDRRIKSDLIQYGVEIGMVRVAANWVKGQLPPTLIQTSLEIKSKSLCAVVGPVGSGKSSLLHLLLGELPVGAGKLYFRTGKNSETKITGEGVRISYASQDPWLFSGTVRHNILFGLPYDEWRYKEVTRVCALHKDFAELPQGDLSFVGERGASLSGGQRARVNLARAVYRDADLYLLDDPLSAVDPHVGRHLFHECITGFLKDKTRILVTHQLQYLRETDTVVVLNRGTVEHQGTYAEIMNSNYRIMDSEDSEESDESDGIPNNYEKILEHKKTAAASADNKDRPSELVTDGNEGYKEENEEETATGSMSNEVYKSYFSAGGSPCALVTFIAIFIIGQMSISGIDYWVTYLTNQETLRSTLRLNDSIRSVDITEHRNDTAGDHLHQKAESQWLDEYGLVRSDLVIYIYTACVLSCMMIVYLRGVLFMRMCMTASRKLHDSMFSNLLRATMRFFNTNPAGRILNRFSKDVGAMDEALPQVLLESNQIFGNLLGIMTMVVVVNIWMIIPAIGTIGIFYLVRIYFIRTAQNIKRLEGNAKSPVFSHVNSTLDGLTTIRSRGFEVKDLLKREFDLHQDTHTGAWYLSIATSVAFGFCLDVISCLFITCVCFSFILMDDGNTLPGSVGLAISQSLMMTGMVQYGIRQSTEVITQMTSVERVLQYTNLPKERSLTSEKPPPPTWPPKGGLIFKDVSMRYAVNKPLVLKTLNVTILPGWKVGIVGRTGAGKSSLISALFRLTGEGLEGEIVLDGLDTGSLGLHELRPRISIIPQEPILFSATLRYNLDPFNEYDDTRLWETLREVELGDAVPSLDFLVAGGGANFSVGQRQLICLARAILRNNRILVLDEATANVDPNTDALIQKTIRRRFANCTVLTIAHRLNTIMDSDRVMVMSGGQIVEFGHPHLLLKNRKAHFSQMLEQTGKTMSEKLAEISKTAFILSQESTDESNEGNVADVNDHQITYL